jgi:hypothetical protein
LLALRARARILRLGALTIAERYCGPAGSGHGGYVAGLLAAFASEPVNVSIRRPVPLASALDVSGDASGRLELRSGAVLIAEAKPETVSVAVPDPVSYAQAQEFSRAFTGFRAHPAPGCFGCGTERDDGLRIYPGPDPESGRVAAPWQPAPALAGTRGRVRPEYLWAALDCPGYFALRIPGLALTASLAVELVRAPIVGEPCVVMGWPIATEGRRHSVGTALFDSAGACVAYCHSQWVELREPEPTATG